MPKAMNNTNFKAAYSFWVGCSSSTNAQKQVSIARILRLEQQTHTRINEVRKASHTNESKHINV